MSRFKAAIFDMDGVLIDSELHWEKCERVFFNSLGVDLTEEMAVRMTGSSLRESVEMMKEAFGLKQSADELMEEKKKRSAEIYDKLAQIMPDAVMTLNIIKNAGLIMAIASGACLDRVETIVNRFGWKNYFAELVSADHVGKVGKPNPAIYLRTAAALNVKPAECVVFEDSENGVKAAKAAGMSCIAIPDPRWSFGNVATADIIVDSISDFKIFDYIGIKREI